MTSEYNTRYQPAYVEFDLFEFTEKLWEQKWLILLITALGTALALAYAMLATPVYQASARLMPPLASDISPINEGRHQAELPELDADDVYTLFLRNLHSSSNRLWFFNEHYRPYHMELGVTGPRDSMLAASNESLQIYPDARAPNISIVSITLKDDPQLAVSWVNLYIERAAQQTVRDLARNAEAAIGSGSAAIGRHIEVLRQNARLQREDRIAALRAALTMAEAAGYEAAQGPQAFSSRATDEGQPQQVVDISQLYMRGAKALRSELQVLEQRENDDPYIVELRDLQLSRGLLQSVNTNLEDVRVFIMDGDAAVPEEPIKPKKIRLIAAGFLLGGILGITVGQLRVALNRRRKALS